MFKRVSKRIKRQEEEEALGLDSEMKEVLGMHDTDSDESESDSEGSESDPESSASSVDGSDEEQDGNDTEATKDSDAEPRTSRKRKLALASDDEDEEDISEDDLEPSISLEQALQDPIYLADIDLDSHACTICPGKALKNQTMIEVHRKSSVGQQSYPLVQRMLIISRRRHISGACQNSCNRPSLRKKATPS